MDTIAQTNIHAKAIIDLAAHVSRLREQAKLLQSQFAARERGYFTPIEDDQMLQVWVSYHKSRNALFDVLLGIQQAVGRATVESADQFILAYAAGLILVDGARSLRDLFGDNQLVRRKLNESLQNFGIPSGSFDAIQKSLTDPSNALKLRSANEFFDENEQLIREIAATDPMLGKVLTVIDGLRQRVEISTGRYLKARAADRGHEIKSLAHRGISRTVYAIQEFGSRLISNISTIPNHIPQLPREIASQMLELLHPGDVLVTRKENALTNYFLPGYWPHVAFYIGDSHVIEALKDGVHERDMDSPFGNDAVAIIRPRVSAETISAAIVRARTHLKKPYDFDFDFTRADRMVCTEVVYRSLEGLEGMSFQLSRRAGRETLSAEDLLRLAMKNQFFDPIAIYCPAHEKTLTIQPRMCEILELTVAKE